MDVQAALRDGYSKEDVAAELGRRTGMNYQQAMKDGHSVDDVIGEMSRRAKGPQAKQAPIVQPEKPRSTLEKVTDYFTKPPERPSSIGDFVTENIPRSFANTLYGAGKITADFLTGKQGEMVNDMLGRPKSLADVGRGALNVVKDTVAPLGLAGFDKFSEAWTTAPVQSALAVSPLGRLAKTAVTSPIKTATAPLFKALPESAPKKLYESAMKFSNNPKVLSPVERRAAIDTGLKGGFRPVDADYERLWQTVNKNRGKVNNIIETGAQRGDMVDTVRALRPLDKIKKRFDLVRDQHPELAEAVDDVYSRYSQKSEIPVKEAQTLKETLQDLANFADDGRSKALNKSYKAVGRGLRIELERLYPELATINKESSALLNLENELAKATGRVGNRDITSLGIRVALSGQPSAVGGANALMSIFEMPRIKARLAIAIYKAKTGKILPVSQWKKAMTHPAVAEALKAQTQQPQEPEVLSPE